MALSKGTWVRPNPTGNVGVTTLEARRAQGALFYETSPGVVRSGILTDNLTPNQQLVTLAAGLFYTLQPANFVIGRAANEGAYLMTSQGTTNTANVAAAPAAGLSRWDLIWIKQNDMDKSDTDTLPVLGVTQGTAAAAPTKPTASVPAGALVLAEAQIFSGTATTAASPNTITQLWRFTSTKHEPVPVRNQAERDELSTRPVGARVRRLDLAAGLQEETWTGTIWDSAMRYVEYEATWNVPGGSVSWDAGPLAVVAGTAKGDQSFHNRSGAVSGAVNIAESGYYEFTSWSVGQSTPGRAWCAIRISGAFADTGATDGYAWEMTTTHACWINAGSDIRLTMMFTNSVNNVQSRVKIRKAL